MSQIDDVKILKMTMAYKKEAALYSEILEKNKELNTHLKENGLNKEAIQIIAEKNAVINRISEIDDEIRSAKSVWENIPDKTNPKYSKIAAILGEIKNVLESIMRFEEENKNLLMLSQNDVKAKINKTVQNKNAISAYKNTGKINTPKFNDDRG